jgi:hypothetical protein
MVRIAYVSVYLIATSAMVLLVNANSGHEEAALVVWGVASISLGLGTGQVALSLLAFLAIPLAIPFGYPDNYQYSEPLPIFWAVAVYAFFSAGIVFLAALVRLIVEKRRRASPSRSSRPARR